MVEAENRHGRPVTRNEIYVVHKQTSYLRLNAMIVSAILADIFRNDELLTNREQCYWSVRADNQAKIENQTGFELYSDRMTRLYPTYNLDSILKLIPGPTTPVVNFNKTKEVLLSTDLSREAELHVNRD